MHLVIISLLLKPIKLTINHHYYHTIMLLTLIHMNITQLQRLNMGTMKFKNKKKKIDVFLDPHYSRQ